MDRRITNALSADERAAVAKRSRRMLAVCFIAIISVLALVTLQRPFDGEAAAQERPRAQPCAQWDEMAGAAIVQRVREQLDLKELGDAIFRMRRARRSCDSGWFWLACEDYQAIIDGAPGPTRPFPESPPHCTLAGIDKPVGAVSR